MSSLVLSDSLLKEYFKYFFSKDFDKIKIKKLLKYIHPFIASKNQFWFNKEDDFIAQLDGDPLIKLVGNKTKSELINMSELKLILVDEYDNATKYTEVNINSADEKMDMLINATYKDSNGKENAQSHIKSLLQNETKITIIDKYLHSQWKTNKKLLLSILPRQLIKLIIITDKNLFTEKQKEDIQASRPQLTISIEDIASDVHDRYIETDKFTIILSSGLYHLSNTSNKDFTYIVKLK